MSLTFMEREDGFNTEAVWAEICSFMPRRSFYTSDLKLHSKTLSHLSRRRVPFSISSTRCSRWASSAPTTAVVQSSVREAFADIRNSLSLVNQGERLKIAEAQTRELAKELEGKPLKDESLWTQDYNGASRRQQQLSHLQKQTSSLQEIQSSLDSLSELAALADESGDSALQTELLPELTALRNRAGELARALLLNAPADSHGAYIEVKAGSGGTEACDWASMLSRMYSRWAQAHDFSVTVVDETLGDVAGVRHRTLRVDGSYAYGYAQFESGIHRLVRMSPFDSAGQRHTSFASVQVSPYFGEEEEGNEKGGGKALIEINPADLKIQTMRSSGAGGQHVNKTESAVRITHVPSGIVVACEQERSQARNRVVALSLLRSRLYDMEQLKKAQAKSASYNNLPEISWGSQIRSYTLAPYQLIKDIRTGYEVGTGGVQAVLEGNVDGAYLLRTLFVLALHPTPRTLSSKRTRAEAVSHDDDDDAEAAGAPHIGPLTVVSAVDRSGRGITVFPILMTTQRILSRTGRRKTGKPY
ncbi:hypothetical protein EW145_g1345 [Phellinidium pouzarii]|uniref:Prokaryotic-type class I peptide chain release factors domain-containing protein n=1 Tax=Phellinidium pouzarii TaxID=167371 RepID=A0A4S4LFD4_9AGAM|nr:hypothetical protein EW145_g1345 [Phellinidium pouzarii]